MTKGEAIKYLQQLYPNGGHCWLDEQRIEAIGMAVKSLQEEPVSEDLEKEIKRYQQEVYDRDTTVKDVAHHFANWQKERFEKNRLAACDRQTEEESEIEWDFVMGIIEKEHRQPTFDDAIKYGYHQAEKDLAFTWKDIELIVNIDKDTDNEESITSVRNNEEHYEEVLKRFNKMKNEDNQNTSN